jgi:hypothetical protein
MENGQASASVVSARTISFALSLKWVERWWASPSVPEWSLERKCSWIIPALPTTAFGTKPLPLIQTEK